MKYDINKWMRVALVMAVAAVSFSCSNEFTQGGSPVELVATNIQDLQVIDLAGDPPGQEDCQRPIGAVQLLAHVKNPLAGQNQQFNAVRVTRYRVSYVRNDGGTLVPAPFVRSMDLLLEPGGAGQALESFQVFQSGAMFQQPFAALFAGDGRDPETGRRFVTLDVIMDFFGETLAGSNVAARTRFTLDFCVSCGGCAPKE
ncbi:MAG TPA: hypothetical protein VM779_16590 [Thermoanaerobaculia bacterium]|nr:hypothetical protein [Thermoanaerobaculia bacterium]